MKAVQLGNSLVSIYSYYGIIMCDNMYVYTFKHLDHMLPYRHSYLLSFDVFFHNVELKILHDSKLY